jgi:hypothetical protein
MRRVIRHGTAQQFADSVDAGFSPNGESMYSRRAASVVSSIATRGHVAKQKGMPLSTAQKIAFQESEMARLRGAILIESNPTRLAKLKKNLAIKQKFVERLKAEQQ